MQAMSHGTRNVALVLALLLTFFALMSYQVNRAETLGAVKGAVFSVFSPFQRLFSSAWVSTTGAWERYFALAGAAEEAELLRAEVGELRREVARLAEARRENERLRSLLGLRTATASPSVVAEVTGRELAHRYETLIINRGSNDGVRVNAVVLAPDGSLVGRVVTVAHWASTVQLVTDPLAAAGARLASSRATGLVYGAGGPFLRLEYVSSRESVAEGDRVVTSGDDGIFPADIPIGTVTEVRTGPAVPGTPSVPLARDETALFLEITVDPYIDVLRLEEVLLLPPIPTS